MIAWLKDSMSAPASARLPAPSAGSNPPISLSTDGRKAMLFPEPNTPPQ